MDDSAPNEGEIPHDIGMSKINSDWHSIPYTWRKYESTIAGKRLSIEDVLTTVGVKATPDYAYYVYIRVVAVNNSGVSQTRQSMYVTFVLKLLFGAIRATSL